MATSVRQNSMPAGGTTAQQAVGPTLTPADIQAIVESIPVPTVVRFRDQSSPMQVALSDMTLSLGQQASIRIASVGLGYRTVTEHVAVFTFTSANAGSQNFPLGRGFPWSLIGNTAVQINGGAQVYSVSGYGGLLVALRNRRGSLGGDAITGKVVGLSDSLCRITVGSNLTLNKATYTDGSTTAGPGENAYLSGYATVAVAANATTNNTMTVTWYSIEKYAYSKDSLLGALPLQNNSTFATLTRTMVGSLTAATGDSAPFGAAPTSVTVALTSYISHTSYKFWSVPQDPSLYQDMVQNSYQVLEQPGNTISATGVAALTYNIPQNMYLTALHLIMADSTGTYINPLTVFQANRLQYNAGSVIPVNEYEGRKLAEQFLDYGSSLANLPGYILWDGAATTEDLNTSDQAGWVDCYSTASPQFIVDIASGLSVPASYSIVRESVVSGAVNVVGG
jgi:hypothetical protein